MLKRKLISVTAALILLSSNVLANKVEFSLGDSSGTFYCTVNTFNPFVKVNISADSIRVGGFCKGQKYVEKNGQIKEMPVSALRKTYFRFKKNLYQFGSVTIENSSAEDAVVCEEGKGEQRKAYGNEEYC